MGRGAGARAKLRQPPGSEAEADPIDVHVHVHRRTDIRHTNNNRDFLSGNSRTLRVAQFCRMDTAVASYNAATMRVGFDVSVDPAAVAGVVELHDQAVYAKVAPQVVKLRGFAQDGSPAGQFSGFVHGDIIVAAGHMQGFTGTPPRSSAPPATFTATYPWTASRRLCRLWPPPHQPTCLTSCY